MPSTAEMWNIPFCHAKNYWNCGENQSVNHCHRERDQQKIVESKKKWEEENKKKDVGGYSGFSGTYERKRWRE